MAPQIVVRICLRTVYFQHFQFSHKNSMMERKVRTINILYGRDYSKLKKPFDEKIHPMMYKSIETSCGRLV